MTTDITELLDLDLVSRLSLFDRLVRINAESCHKFLSRQNTVFCRDKTHLLSRQNTSFVATNMCFSRQHVFVATKMILVADPALIVQELCESRGGRPRLSVLTSLLVSVDVKNY